MMQNQWFAKHHDFPQLFGVLVFKILSLQLRNSIVRIQNSQEKTAGDTCRVKLLVLQGQSTSATAKKSRTKI